MRIGWRAPKATSWRVDQPAVPRERFEDVADVGVGDPDVLCQARDGRGASGACVGLRAAYAKK